MMTTPQDFAAELVSLPEVGEPESRAPLPPFTRAQAAAELREARAKARAHRERFPDRAAQFNGYARRLAAGHFILSYGGGTGLRLRALQEGAVFYLPDTAKPIAETAMPLATVQDVLNRYLTASAYDYGATGSAVYVDAPNVAFVRGRLEACGHGGTEVRARP